MVYFSVISGGILQVTPAVSLFQWNRDFYNFQGKWKFVRKISENMFEKSTVAWNHTCFNMVLF